MQHLQKTEGRRPVIVNQKLPLKRAAFFNCLNFCEELNPDCEVHLKSTLSVAILIAGSFLGFAFHSAIPSGAFAANDQSVVLVGAAAIADFKDLTGADATAKLLDQLPGTVMAVGDLAYPHGSKENFTCYDKTCGRAKTRTRPAVGNPELHATRETPPSAAFAAPVPAPQHGHPNDRTSTPHI